MIESNATNTDPYNLTTSYIRAYNIVTNNKGNAMPITIIDMNTHTPVLAKDIAPSRHTVNQLDNATAAAHHSRSHKAYALISMANHTQQLATITVD